MPRKNSKLTDKQQLQDSAARYCEGISEKRVRRPVQKDDAYFRAVAAEEADAGPRGGLVAGSGYHYDRAYRGGGFYCDREYRG